MLYDQDELVATYINDVLKPGTLTAPLHLWEKGYENKLFKMRYEPAWDTRQPGIQFFYDERHVPALRLKRFLVERMEWPYYFLTKETNTDGKDMEDNAMEDNAMEDNAMEDNAMEDNAMEDNAMEDNATEDNATEEKGRVEDDAEQNDTENMDDKDDIKDKDTDTNYMLSTRGLVPFRWLHMINDFCFNGQGVVTESLSKTTDHQSLAKAWKAIPTTTAKQILHPTVEYHMSCRWQVSVEHPDWATDNGKFSPYAAQLLGQANKYGSTDHQAYKRLFACEGGIEYPYNRYVKAWIKLYHGRQDALTGSIRNESKGRRSYRTNKDVTFEELVVLYEVLRVQNCPVTITGD